MGKGRLIKSDEEFFDENIPFFKRHGSNLQSICPDCVDKYDDHSLFKLICITYWIGFFLPIVEKLRGRYGYQIAYVDSMAGSGVTCTKRANDYFCGSYTGAMLYSSEKIGKPFDTAIGVEINENKANALRKRLTHVAPETKVRVYNDDILNVSTEIAESLKKKTVSYIVIDPHALQGMKWEGISPLLSCKGDAMITWFEHEVFRLRESALTTKDHPSKKGHIARMNELFGNEKWKDARTPSGLTELFVKRVLDECDKTAFEKIEIRRQRGQFYHMLLFAGNFPEAKSLVGKWRAQMDRRKLSPYGKDISKLLDVKAGRTSSLDHFS